FPFGSEEFVRLRERLWLDTISAAAATGRSLIFTFAPEPTVAADLPARVIETVKAAGGKAILVALEVSPEEQERRLCDPSRAAFGKLRSVETLRELRDRMAASMLAMPAPALRVDTEKLTPEQAAD